MLPAASEARIVIVFVPIRSEIEGVFQLFVPDAVPEPPVEFVQVTAVTPTLSDAVPENTMVEADVAMLVPAGDRMVKVGGVVSVVGADGAYVTTIVAEAVPPLLP